MSARRQASTTSLSKYARTGSPLVQHGSFDFCNSFWGLSDSGVEALLARMRGATRTTEELRNFWKERAAIEEDYAKRLAKLSKVVLGKDEIGDLRISFNTVKDETDKQATFHMTLAQQIRTELETPCVEYSAKQVHHKKTYQASIEKEFKAKQTQETYVDKARERYEQDCLRINSYTAQSSLVQGRDWEKIQLKLERAKQTVQTNERDFANFTRAMESTVQKWEQDWKAFCDSCQDLEEGRIEFMKNNMWAYANLVSMVCVADDESCEKVRVSLEQMEVDRELENFVRDYGTGSQIPDPPAFVNYQLPDAIPSSSSRPTFRQANFVRSSARDVPIQLHRNSVHVPPPPEEEPNNNAGVGTGMRRADTVTENTNLARQPTQRNSVYGGQQQPHVNGHMPGYSPSPSQRHNPINGTPDPSPSPGTSPSGAHLQRQQTSIAQSSSPAQPSHRPPAAPYDPLAEPIDPNAETYIRVGNNTYKVDPSRDPQISSGAGPANRVNGAASSAAKQNGVDPLQKQLEELQNAVSTSGSTRRNTIYKGQASNATTGAGPSGSGTGNAIAGPSHTRGQDSLGLGGQLAPRGTSASPGATGSGSQHARDYRNSADLVVGAPPPAASRSASPNPPTANFMIPKNTVAPSGSEVVHEVLADYHQSLPGERKSISRSNSRRGSVASQHVQSPASASAAGYGAGPGHGHSLSVTSQHGQTLARTPSVGHVGIGAYGGSRSNSPQPPSRGPSPGPGEIVNVNAVMRQPSQAQPAQQLQNSQQPQQFQQPQQQRRNSAYITPPSSGTPARATSPNNVGIALDSSGRVWHDDMAQRYQQQQLQQRGQTPLGHSQAVSPYGGIAPTNQHQQPQSQQPQQPQQPQQRRPSYLGGATAPGTPAAPAMAPPAQPMYSAVTPPPPPPPLPQVVGMYQVPQAQAQQGYMTPAPTAPGYGHYPQQQQAYQQPQQSAYAMVNGQQRGGNTGGYLQPGTGPSRSQSQLTLSGSTMVGSMYGGYRDSASPVGRSPSPQPLVQIPHQPVQQVQQSLVPRQQQQQPPATGQTTEDGMPILFYVKALYDYQATIDEEFDFQAGDIIAVTATPEDGWWSGELLDEARRQRGRYVFPSNFVCLF